jgi:2'-5' RNA ligase
MALLSLQVPHEVSRALKGVQVPGTPESSESHHVTLLYLGKDIPIDDVSKALVVAYRVAEITKPIPLAIERVSSFPEGDDGVPIIGLVDSPELHQLWEALGSAFDRDGVEYSKKFPIYKPHVTLAYNPSRLESDLQVGPFEWVAYEMTLWSGNSGDDAVTIKIPFSFPSKSALYRKLVQARLRFPRFI